MFNKNTLVITIKTYLKLQCTTQAKISIFQQILRELIINIIYLSISKQLINFQKFLVFVMSLWRGKGQKSVSHVKRPRRNITLCSEKDLARGVGFEAGLV
jgi:hypothetical protein